MIKPYLQLIRIPNLFTAIADVTVGFLFVHTALDPLAVFLPLLAASCLLYMAGMVLNDFYDYDVDLRDRPHRPLPSGRIQRKWAGWLGYWMLGSGVACGWIAGYVYTGEAGLAWRSGAVATTLAACVVLYDRLLKWTPLGPIAMGACRMLNLLLGMSTAAVVTWSAGWRSLLLGYEPAQLLAAGGIGVYIAGVTWYARTEASVSSRLHLAGATSTILAGIGIVAMFPRSLPIGLDKWNAYADRVPWLMLMLALLIGWRCLRGVWRPEPQFVQAAIKVCLMSLIVLDAAICLAVRGPIFATGVILLLIPTVTLGKWVYTT